VNAASLPAEARAAEGDGRHKAVLEAPDIRRALTRIAHEILERTKGGADVVPSASRPAV
jgi:pyrimidine operon attenuation protein/uracil phosphoribosyltransferase